MGNEIDVVEMCWPVELLTWSGLFIFQAQLVISLFCLFREHNRRALRTARAVRQAVRNSRSSANSSYGNESESTIGSPLAISRCASECELSDGGYGADIDSILR